ncbi:MAG TPA: RodZ domain-containing protein [Bacillales bacterium]|nr:RodZ domain-containing protein [Bacillales bacterium]
MSELGDVLRSTREEKEITLEQLQASTKIQKRYLQAVEDGNYSMLPGNFYARAFIRSYAEAVGLDPRNLFEQFNADIPKTSEQPETLPSRSQRSERRTGSTEPSKWASLFPKLLVALLVIGVLFAIWAAYQHSTVEPEAGTADKMNDSDIEFSENLDATKEADDSKDNGVDQEAKPNEEEDEQTPSEKQSSFSLVKTGVTNGIAEYTLKNADEFVLKLKVVDGASWVEIRKDDANGEKLEWDTFKAGKTITHDLSGAERIFVKIGSSPHVKLSINGKPFELPSDAIVQKLLFTYERPDEVS